MDYPTVFNQFPLDKVSKLTALALALSASSALVSQSVSAHGYMVSPESRSYSCKLGNNVNCGAIQWEPQSVEGPSGFPELGPADGKIASAANTAFSTLDEQSPSRWAKSDISAGWNQFSWQFTANHITRNWRYYLTRQDWDQNQPLSRASFELAPFCVIDGGMTQPAKLTTHNCYVPEGRTGYQVILAVWEVGDTTNSFYNVLDVNFSGGSVTPQEWTDIGDINPSIDLKAGDKVMTRVFNANGEMTAKQTVVSIADATQGAKENWPFMLASAINSQQTDLKAGQKNASGGISPVYGKNEVFSAPNSGIERVEVSFDIAPETASLLQVTSLADNYLIEDGAVQVTFDVTTNAKMQVSAYLFSHDGSSAGFVTQTVNNNSASLALKVVEPVAGHYHLQVKAENEQGEVIQQNFDIFLKDKAPVTDTDFVFPEGLSSYVAGTKVLQPKTGKVYQCKPWPYSGYCVQWSATATGFEPGVGASWALAWTEL